jgi:leucyl/phenylalanyl-tRNA--protein transferase
MSHGHFPAVNVPYPPIEPPATTWVMPDPDDADDSGVAGLGADLEPGTVLAAYRSGLFPMHVQGDVLAWWSPDPRCVIVLDDLHVSRSLRRSLRRYDVTVDRAFDAVLAACADPPRPHGWINDDIRSAYRYLHRLGWAHSVEVWDKDAALVGGLYGIGIRGLFAGESMFHTRTDASKVALVHLVRRLREAGATLLDVQWCTPHLESLGAAEVPRTVYLRRLLAALTQTGIAPFTSAAADSVDRVPHLTRRPDSA